MYPFVEKQKEGVARMFTQINGAGSGNGRISGICRNQISMDCLGFYFRAAAGTAGNEERLRNG